MAQRFRDSGQTAYNFGTMFLVHCPQCDRYAEVQPMTEEPIRPAREARLACTHCGYNKTITSRTITVGAAVDWYFQLPLWLQIPCCGELLWAYNPAHLDFLAAYVQAVLARGRAARYATRSAQQHHRQPLAAVD